LEEDISEGTRYRDHYIHMFEVFITGSRIISQILSTIPENEIDKFILKTFKTTREPKDLPFPNPYSAKQRLFFLWTLIATFHDIGIPVEHICNVRVGLNKYLTFFGLQLDEFKLYEKTKVSTQLDYYFRLMSRLYKCGIYPNSNSLLYHKEERENKYLYHALLQEYGERNHSVISAVCLFNSYVETFLIGHHEQSEYDLNIIQYSDFIDRVLEQDITRAALAISYHNINIERFPKLFPVDSNKFPLGFLLILCDEIQEAFRLEGITFVGIRKLTRIPKIQVKITTNPIKILIKIIINYINLNPNEEQSVLEASSIWGKQTGITVPSTYTDLLVWTWENICNKLRKKLLFESGPFKLHLMIYFEQDSNKTKLIYEEEFK
jgi:hypothetical protein